MSDYVRESALSLLSFVFVGLCVCVCWVWPLWFLSCLFYLHTWLQSSHPLNKLLQQLKPVLHPIHPKIVSLPMWYTAWLKLKIRALVFLCFGRHLFNSCLSLLQIHLTFPVALLLHPASPQIMFKIPGPVLQHPLQPKSESTLNPKLSINSVCTELAYLWLCSAQLVRRAKP